MKTRKTVHCGILALLAALAFIACEESGNSTLRGTITISPASATVGQTLTAIYTGTETVSYQWKRGTNNIGKNSATHTPSQPGSYTVTVSAIGYASKTSSAVSVSYPALTGDITITPDSVVTVNTELTATYTGTETVNYQWKRGTTNVGENSNTYTPDQPGSYTVTVSASGYDSKTSAVVTVVSTLAERLTWLSSNAASDKTYTFEINANESIAPQSLSYIDRNNITIILKGTGAERIISLSSNGRLFTVGSGVTLVLDNNITLQGRTDNNDTLVKIDSGGTLIINNGAKISGNNAYYSIGGGVIITSGGTFTMNDGEISGNTTSSSTNTYGGGVYVASGGTFIMNDGKISNNTANSTSTATYYYTYGGGVYVASGGTFTMNNGEISGNTASSSTSSSRGGGVYVASGITFTMNNGKISGNTASSVYNSATSQGGGVYTAGTFIMNGGEISGNTAYNPSGSSGGGVYIYGAFLIVNGTVYGLDAEEGLKNTANSGAAFNGTAQRGTFSGTTWNISGSMSTTNNTIRVEDGEL